MRRIKLISTLLAMAFFMASCSKEEVVQDAATGYPAEITIDNWRQFVDAPEEVLEKIRLAEMQNVKRPEVKANDFDASRIILGNLLLGEIQVRGYNVNTPTAYLGGTLVRMTQGTTNSNSTSSYSPFYMGQNWFLTNLNPSQICFYHQGNTSGTFSQAEWVKGVSASDLVIIQKHINNIAPFTRLWQHLAADANGDGLVNATDITIFQQLILGVTNSLPPMATGSYNQPVIYFPQGDYDAIDADLPGNLPFITEWYDELACQAANSTSETDRYAIKRGDLNATWVY